MATDIRAHTDIQIAPQRAGLAGAASAPAKVDAEHARHLSLESQEAPNALLRAPSEIKPQLPAPTYRANLTRQSGTARQAIVDHARRENMPRYVKSAVAHMNGKDARKFAHKIQDKDVGLVGYAGQRRSAAAIVVDAQGSLEERGMQAPSSTKLETSILLRQKKGVLKQFNDLKGALDPMRRRVATGDGELRQENNEEAVSRVYNGMTRLKFAVRELLVIAHSERAEVVEQQKDPDIRSDDAADHLEELETAIVELEELDGALHDQFDELGSVQQDIMGKKAEVKALTAENRKFTAMLGNDIALYQHAPGRLADDIYGAIAWSKKDLQDKILANTQNISEKEGEIESLADDAAELLGVVDNDGGVHLGDDNLLEADDDPQKIAARNAKALIALLDRDQSGLTESIQEIGERFEAAWKSEPDYLENLWERNQAPAGAMEQDQRHDALCAALDAYDDAYDRIPENLDKQQAQLAAQRTAGLHKDEKPGAVALFTVAEDVGIADEIEARCHGQLETHVDSLEKLLDERHYSGLELTQRGPFQEKFQEMRELAQKITVCRNAASAREKNAELLFGIEDFESQVDSLREQIQDKSLNGEEREELQSKLDQATKDLQVLKQRQARLPSEEQVIAIAQNRGIDVELDDVDRLQEHSLHFRDLSHDVNELMKQKLSDYVTTPRRFSRVKTRRKRAEALVESMKQVRGLGADLLGANRVKTSRLPGGPQGVSRNELVATLKSMRTERNELDYNKGRNLTTGQSVKRGFKKFGRWLCRMGKPSSAIKNTAKGVGAGLEAARYAQIHKIGRAADMRLSEAKVLKAEFGMEIGEHALGSLAAGVGAFRLCVALADKKEKAEVGASLVKQYEKQNVECRDHLSQVEHKYTHGVTQHFGNQLQRQHYAATSIEMGASAAHSLRYAFDTARPILETKMHLMGKTGHIAGEGVAGVLNAIEGAVSLYEAGEAVHARHKIDVAAKDHKHHVVQMCADPAVGNGRFKIAYKKNLTKRDFQNPVDVAETLKNIKASDLSADIKEKLSAEVKALGETEVLVAMLKGHTNLGDKIGHSIYKFAAAGGYAAAFGVTTGLIGGATVVTGGGATLGAAGAAGGYYAFKGIKNARKNYQADRSADALLGTASPKTIQRLKKSAAEKNVGHDPERLGVMLISARDPTIAAKQALHELRDQTKDIVTPESLGAIIETEAKCQELGDQIVRLSADIKRLEGELGPDRTSAQLDQLHDQLADSVLLASQANTSLHHLKREMNQAILETRMARTLYLAQGMSPEQILALIVADSSVEDHAVGAITESITRRN